METHSGFTLVELTVVIAIIVILIAVITPNAFRAIEKAKIAKVCYDAKLIDRACEALWSDTGYWPVVDRRRIKQSELMLNIYGWQGWNGPYLEGEYNLWVVFLYKDKKLKEVIGRLYKQTGKENILNLKTIRQFKLKTRLNI